MLPLLTREASRAIDQDAVERLGVPSLTLMETAGRGAFDAILAKLPNAIDRVVIVGGPGQNGGDGWVVARHLAEAGKKPLAFLVGDPTNLRGDATTTFAALGPIGVEIRTAAPDDPALPV